MWKKGQKKRMAVLSGITQQLFNDIIKRRKSCPAQVAIKLQASSKQVLGHYIPVEDWLESKTTSNPYFGGN